MKKICLFLSGTLLGCTTTTQSQYCINVEEDIECPTLNYVNETTFPAEDCGGTHTQATVLFARNESVSVWEEDTALDNQYDGCCYTTLYVAPVGVDCIE
ncbi:MAG: hypothetical protein CL916_15545 [Deltaproteobacteria bacterium]|nr:hypothetical protein [Deltaproteobacteria bacterium]